MKKYLLTAVLVFGLIGVAKSDMRPTPNGSGSALATADYGGVDYATAPSLSSTGKNAFSGSGSFQGLHVSSFANATPPVTLKVYDSTSVTLGPSAVLIDTVYVTTTSQLPIVNYNFRYKPTFPIRVKRGLTVIPSDATLPDVTVLGTKFGN